MLAALTVGLFSDDITWFLARGRSPVAFIDEDFNDGVLLRPEWVTISGFVSCLDGWCLKPGTSGTLLYRPVVPLDRVRDIQASLWLYAPPGVTNRMLASGDDGHTFDVVGTNMNVVGQRIGLKPYLAHRRGPLLVFEASNPGATLVLVVDKLTLTYLDAPLHLPPSPWRVFAAFLAFGASGVILCRRWPVAAGSLVIVAFGAVLRYGFLVEAYARPLDPDAQGYRLYGNAMSLFTAHGFYSARFSEREPLFILVTHVLFRLIGESDFHMRLVSFILSIVLIWLVVRIGIALFGVSLGWIIGAMIALNRPLATESVRGLRLELETIVFLLVLACAFLLPRRRGLTRAVLLGALGGAMVLIRSTYVPVMAVVCAFCHYRERQTRWDWLTPTAVSLVLMIALVVPHRVSMYRLHGDAFWDTTAYARWNANFEFAGRPGFPTRAQLEANSYAGPRITYAHYTFGMHTISELIVGTLRGYIKLFAQMTERAGHGWLPLSPLNEVLTTVLRLLAVAGFALACVRADSRWLAIAFVAVEFPVAFLYDRRLLDDRHILSSFPLVLFAAAVAVSWGAARLARVRRPSC